jgi:hypothetical protein
MIRMLGAFMFLGLASALPVQQAAAQDVLGGAIVGGRSAVLSAARSGEAAERLPARLSAPPPARSLPPKPSAGRAAIIGGGAVAITATPTAHGCKCSRVIARTDPPILRS